MQGWLRLNDPKETGACQVILELQIIRPFIRPFLPFIFPSRTRQKPNTYAMKTHRAARCVFGRQLPAFSCMRTQSATQTLHTTSSQRHEDSEAKPEPLLGPQDTQDQHVPKSPIVLDGSPMPVKIDTKKKTVATVVGDLPLSPFMDPEFHERRQRFTKPKPRKRSVTEKNKFQRLLARNPYGISSPMPARCEECPLILV